MNRPETHALEYGANFKPGKGHAFISLYVHDFL